MGTIIVREGLGKCKDRWQYCLELLPPADWEVTGFDSMYLGLVSLTAMKGALCRILKKKQVHHQHHLFSLKDP